MVRLREWQRPLWDVAALVLPDAAKLLFGRPPPGECGGWYCRGPDRSSRHRQNDHSHSFSEWYSSPRNS